MKFHQIFPCKKVFLVKLGYLFIHPNLFLEFLQNYLQQALKALIPIVGNTFKITKRGGELVIQGLCIKLPTITYTNKLFNNFVGYYPMLAIL